MASVTVVPVRETPAIRARARQLAEVLVLPLVEDVEAADSPLCLLVDEDRLWLHEVGAEIGKPICVDFVGGSVGHRRLAAGGRGQPLTKAIGWWGPSTTVVDGTAGMGADAFHLACLDYQVVAVERSRVIGELFRDGLARARSSANEAVCQIAERIEYVAADAREYLAALSGDLRPDVVYLDPMFPPKPKSAAGKKEMRMFRHLVGDDSDASDLLDVALATARRRVVVKRHRHAQALAPGVAHAILGRSIRYDVYVGDS